MNIKKIYIYFFDVIALCKFGHRKLDFSTARSFKLGKLIEDNE